MINNAESLKKFKKILETKENEGYLEWKDWVLDQIKNFNRIGMSNLIKRTEIRIKLLESGDAGQNLLKDVAAFLPAIIAAFVTLSMEPLSNMFEVYNSKVEMDIINEYALLVAESTLEQSGLIMKFCMLFILIFIIALLAERWLDKRANQKNAMLKAYYEELLEVLKEKMDKMPEEEIDPNVGSVV